MTSAQDVQTNHHHASAKMSKEKTIGKMANAQDAEAHAAVAVAQAT